MWQTTFETPLGTMLVAASERGIAGVYFVGQKYFPAAASAWVSAPDHDLLARARRAMLDYFGGGTAPFSLPLDLRGTAFQVRVWTALMEIPYGETTSYGEVSARLGGRTAARAVGAAVGRNPVSIIVPCHRVLGAGGALTGYAGGLDRKRALLALEGAASSWAPASAGAGPHPANSSCAEPKEAGCHEGGIPTPATRS
jgi:methylated-DNA-[protein]-cysteine S-methyltransferase